MKTGILGGTFNPIHLAHLRIAEEVREACLLDRVMFIPAATPPHKPLADEISFSHRLAMVEMAIKSNPTFAVSDLEGQRPGKSYSVRSLELLREANPKDSFYFIIGMDSYQELSSWKDYERLFELTNLVVSTRPGSPKGDLLKLLPVVIQNEFCYDDSPNTLLHHSGNRVILLEETFLDISSTQLRKLISEERSVRYLISEGVEEYIYRHGLYRRQERS